MFSICSMFAIDKNQHNDLSVGDQNIFSRLIDRL